MKFLQLVCIENETTDEQNRVMETEVFPWVDDTIARRINITGKPLAPPSTAKTVRVRNGDTLISDGPFVQTREFVGGFDLLNCATFEEAVGWAARHPIARFHQIEVRSFVDLGHRHAVAA